MDESARDPTDASTSSEDTEDSRHSSEEDVPLEYENKRLRREVERLKDKICDLQRSLRRQQRSKETAPGTLCMITYLDFAEDDIQKVEDVLLQCRTKAEGSRRYGAPRYAPRAAIEVQYIKFIDPEHGPQLLRIGGQEYAADVEAPSFMEVPIYHRASDTPLDNAPPKEKDNGESKCFNCGQPGHSVAECPEPRDQAAIQRNRREFLDSTPVRFTGRYATSQKVLLDKFKPGELSEELKQALDGEEPPYYSNMRVYGYPPGYIGRKRTPLARKQEVAVPELIYLDRADEQIDCRNDDEQEGEIVQLVQYPGLGLSLDPLLVERKFPTRRPHKRKRESSEEIMETDMDMSDDDSSVPQPAPQQQQQQQQQQYAYSGAYGYPYGYDYSMSPYAYTPQTASVASSPYPPQAPPTIAATSKPPQPALPPAPAPQFTSPVAASQPSDAATPLSPPGSPSADLFGSLPPVEPPVPVAQDAQALQAKQERLLARWRTMVQNRVPATGAAAAPGGQQFQKAMSHPGWSQQGQ